MPPASSLLDKRRTVAAPGFNRWLVPPAALCIHLCIGMAYGFSVFWRPLAQAVGITAPVRCPEAMSLWARLTTTACDWDKPLLGWTYTLFFVFLGGSAAVLGPWLERAGPRKAGVVSACCWCGGLAIGAGGVWLHQLWLVWLGAGVIGGIGLGIGYISPVSTLIRWFPDRRGLATGMAIMGFGGGAMIGSPLADRLMGRFAGPESVGVWQTMLVLAGFYFCVMMIGAFAYRIPAADLRPAASGRAAPPSTPSLTAAAAVRTPQFWLLWLVLCLNVSAGIGVLGMASPMLQEIFGGRLLGVDATLDGLDHDQSRQVASMAAGFTGLLSLFNILGRFAWSTLSDQIGRRAVYAMIFAGGTLLYALVPAAGRAGDVAAFCGIMCLILSMYGGGFAAIPAYLADLFGTAHVGAIHGRLLTAWSVAGCLGPATVNYVNGWQVAAGVPAARAYDRTMLLLAGMLVVGFVCNLAIRPLRPGDGRTGVPHDHGGGRLAPTADGAAPVAGVVPVGSTAAWLPVAAMWLLVLIPLAWGTWQTLRQAAALLG